MTCGRCDSLTIQIFGYGTVSLTILLCIGMFNIRGNNFCKPFIIEMLISRVNLEMELDTSAGISVLPENILREK